MNAKTLDIPCPCWIVLAVSYTSELRLLLTTTSRLFSLQHCNSPSFPVSLHCRALFQPIFDAASGRDMRLTKHPRCIFTPPLERLGCEDGQTHCHWPLAGHWAGLPIASQVVDRVGRHEVRLQSDDITL